MSAPASATAGIAGLLTSELFADLVIQPSDAKAGAGGIRCHKCLVAAQSPALADLLQKQLEKQKVEAGKLPVFALPDVEESTWRSYRA